MVLGAIILTILKIVAILFVSLAAIKVGGWCIKGICRIIAGCSKILTKGFHRW